MNPCIVLDDIRRKNVGRLLIGHLNINSIRNKFDELTSLIHDKFDIFIVSETKIDNSFPVNQFSIKGFCDPFRQDRNSEGGGILIYIRENVPCKEIKIHKLTNNFEGIFVELTLRKSKWLLFGGYNPKKEKISDFLQSLGK